MEKRNFVSDLHLACAKDELRPVFECVHFVNGYAYASDSGVMIRQSLEYSDLEGDMTLLDCKAIHMDSFKEIRKYQVVEVTEDGFDCTAKNGRKTFFPFRDFDDAVKVPDFDAAIPGGITQVGELGISPKKVAVLEKGMAGGGLLKMTFTGVNRGIVFHSMDENYPHQLAIVMPNMLSNDE